MLETFHKSRLLGDPKVIRPFSSMLNIAHSFFRYRVVAKLENLRPLRYHNPVNDPFPLISGGNLLVSEAIHILFLYFYTDPIILSLLPLLFIGPLPKH